MNWYLSGDPSYFDPRGNTSNSDFATLVLVGMDWHMRNLYVRHFIRKKMSYGGVY
jgi:hypothetical protein